MLPPDTKVSDIGWVALMRRDEHVGLQPPAVTPRRKRKGKPARRERNSP